MKKKTVEGGSNVFSMFEQSQIQEFKEVKCVVVSSQCFKYCLDSSCLHLKCLNHYCNFDVWIFFFL